MARWHHKWDVRMQPDTSKAFGRHLCQIRVNVDAGYLALAKPVGQQRRAVARSGGDIENSRTVVDLQMP